MKKIWVYLGFYLTISYSLAALTLDVSSQNLIVCGYLQAAPIELVKNDSKAVVGRVIRSEADQVAVQYNYGTETGIAIYRNGECIPFDNLQLSVLRKGIEPGDYPVGSKISFYDSKEIRCSSSIVFHGTTCWSKPVRGEVLGHLGNFALKVQVRSQWGFSRRIYYVPVQTVTSLEYPRDI